MTQTTTPSPLPVSETTFRQQLDRIVSEVKDPALGVFGPDSWMWEITRHTMVFAGGMGRRVTLQVAHPWVTSGVDQHSRVREDATGRARRTYRIVFQMIYGTLDQALQAAELAHKIHARIEGDVKEGSGQISPGSRYMANEAHAMLWIHATMWDTFVRVYELFVRPLSAAEKDAFYQETRRFAWLFGIPDEVLPVDWEDFQRYVHEVMEGNLLAVNPSTLELTNFVMTPPNLMAVAPMQWLKTMTTGLFSEQLRQAYGWPHSPTRFRLAVAMGKLADKTFPGRLRYIPSWHEAQARLHGKTADRFTRRLNQRLFRSELLVS